MQGKMGGDIQVQARIWNIRVDRRWELSAACARPAMCLAKRAEAGTPASSLSSMG